MEKKQGTPQKTINLFKPSHSEVQTSHWKNPNWVWWWLRQTLLDFNSSSPPNSFTRFVFLLTSQFCIPWLSVLFNDSFLQPIIFIIFIFLTENFKNFLDICWYSWRDYFFVNDVLFFMITVLIHWVFSFRYKNQKEVSLGTYWFLINLGSSFLHLFLS